MSRQDNPFALLGDDDEEDISVLVAKVEAKLPSIPVSATEQTKLKIGNNGFSSKSLAPSESVRGRGRGGRGRGGVDQTEGFYDRGYGGESGGERERGRGRGGRGGLGRGRGRGFNGFVNRNQMEYAGNGGEEGGELQEKSYYGENRSNYDRRRFGEENRGPDGVERDDHNRGLRGHGSDFVRREFRDGEGYQRKREFREGEGFDRSYGGDGDNRGFRGGEGRGRGYGGRGRWGGRDGGRGGGGRYESNDGLNAYETKKVSVDEKEPNENSTINGDGGSGRNHPNATEEPTDGQSEKPTDGQSEKPTPEQITSEDTSKVPEEVNEMTLAEYEKLLQEKRKPLESLKMEVRRVVADKDFEGMQIIEKKKEDDITKVKLDNDKGKKKEFTEREDKSRKSQSINEFLKPADGERYRGAAAASRGRGGGRGRGRGGDISDYPRQPVPSASTPSLEDPVHFPNLGAVAKA